MSTTHEVDTYLNAAVRDNTRRSYDNARRHFEVEWGGLLPASAQTVARYLAHYAESLAPTTLTHRLAALAKWHVDHGFPDPTRAALVRQVLRGIRTIHASQARQAKALPIEQLAIIDASLVLAIETAQSSGDRAAQLRHRRNRALLLLGFWRGLRGDDLLRLRVEHLEISPGEGMRVYLLHSKTDRDAAGRTFSVPALSRLCPVAACQAWIDATSLTNGPLFRAVDRWGHLRDESLHPNSLIPLLRALFTTAGVPFAQAYSAHSLRRGFAGWATAHGWHLRELMDYVGWHDVRSAMRYLDASVTTVRERFEAALQVGDQPPLPSSDERSTAGDTIELEVMAVLDPLGKTAARPKRARALIEQTCLAPHSMQRLSGRDAGYRLALTLGATPDLDEVIYALLDDMHRIADTHLCVLDAHVRDPATGQTWD